jgi:hypothetical protein
MTEFTFDLEKLKEEIPTLSRISFANEKKTRQKHRLLFSITFSESRKILGKRHTEFVRICIYNSQVIWESCGDDEQTLKDFERKQPQLFGWVTKIFKLSGYEEFFKDLYDEQVAYKFIERKVSIFESLMEIEYDTEFWVEYDKERFLEENQKEAKVFKHLCDKKIDRFVQSVKLTIFPSTALHGSEYIKEYVKNQLSQLVEMFYDALRKRFYSDLWHGNTKLSDETVKDFVYSKNEGKEEELVKHTNANEGCRYLILTDKSLYIIHQWNGFHCLVFDRSKFEAFLNVLT